MTPYSMLVAANAGAKIHAFFSLCKFLTLKTFTSQKNALPLHCLIGQSECSAVGSALRSGRRGRAFESPHSDRETEVAKLQFLSLFFCFVRFFTTENSSLNSILPTETYRYTDGLTPFSGQRDIPYEKDMGLNEKTPISERKDTHI